MKFTVPYAHLRGVSVIPNQLHPTMATDGGDEEAYYILGTHS
jgi:hypothetical protein